MEAPRLSSILAVVLASAALGACGASPGTAFAREIERAASWGGAAAFARAAAAAGSAPAAFAARVDSDGAEAIEQSEKRISRFRVDPAARAEAERLCGEMVAMLRQSGPRNPRALTAAASELRALAGRVREGAR